MGRRPLSESTKALLASRIQSGAKADNSLASVIARGIVVKALRETLGLG